MKFILVKIGMTQVFRADGTVVPVTQIEAALCYYTGQNKSQGWSGFDSSWFGEQKNFV